MPAVVPGAVQLDWAAAHGWEPHWYADNWRQYDWMEDSHWVYRSRLKLPPEAAGRRVFFLCGGIDYRFEVWHNHTLLLQQEGMFTPVELELEEARDGDLLQVVIHPAPKSCPAPRDRTQANHSCKPAVAYEWDFHPRLIPLGIWKAAGLELRREHHLQRVECAYQLSTALDEAVCTLEVQTAAAAAARVHWQLLSPQGKPVVEQEARVRGAGTLQATVTRPRLWWPHDQGTPALYVSVVQMLDARGRVQEEHRQQIGFRRVRLVMAEGSWEMPERFPKTRSTPPITLEINGRRIFARGSNWVTPDVFPGRVTPADIEAHLKLARRANMNLLRCWGGAAVPRTEFFETCDRLGIMVWQEFPLACNCYPDDADYLAVLNQESRSIIQALRGHPSLVVWCGGNELFNVWSGMTDQALPLRLLNRNCFDLDSERPFLATSPVMGMGHGHYVPLDQIYGDEPWALFQQASCTAYTEFGCGGPSSVAALKKFLLPEHWFPPAAGTPWETHHGLKAWHDDSHLYLEAITHYYGAPRNLEELVQRGQMLQGEVLKGLFEEARRQKPHAAMALNWCLNEPWPCAANNSLVEWPCRAKPALHEVGQACRPVLASARIRQLLWRANEWFDPELWLLNDAPRALPPLRVEARLRAGAEEIFLLGWEVPALAAGENLRGPRIQFRLPAWTGDSMTLELSVVGHPAWDSTYRLPYRGATFQRDSGTRALNE